ncbi:MAG: aldolase/citrate lyase family protein [Desulfocapsaceae bacterium]|jgi:4-hydroxy-2-oxoheptanedioate aldolase
MFTRENKVKRWLAEGANITPMWTQSGSPTIVEAAVYAGWQTILIDNEHGYTDLETTIHLIRAVEGAGGEVIVRVPWNDQVYLKRILDIGVQSLMIPMVNDRESAQEAVAACRYPPAGRRGYAAPVVRASGYGADSGYGARANAELLLIVQIEHVDAVEQIEEIAAVDGIDMLFIGPMDFAGSMGCFEGLTEPEVIAAIQNVEQRILGSGTLLGGFPLPGTTTAKLLERGYRLVAGQADIWLFSRAAAQALENL